VAQPVAVAVVSVPILAVLSFQRANPSAKPGLVMAMHLVMHGFSTGSQFPKQSHLRLGLVVPFWKKKRELLQVPYEIDSCWTRADDLDAGTDGN